MTHLDERRSSPATRSWADDCPRLVVVDADDRTRESLVGLLGIRNQFRVVGSAGDARTALAAVRTHRPDVVVLDPRLPEIAGGLSLIRAIHAIDPAIRVLVVGWSPEFEHDTLVAGANGFVRKTFRPSELADAIGRCMEGCAPGSAGNGSGTPPVLE